MLKIIWKCLNHSSSHSSTLPVVLLMAPVDLEKLLQLRAIVRGSALMSFRYSPSLKNLKFPSCVSVTVIVKNYCLSKLYFVCDVP